jgi:non-reducing end alpha-L-arabinofuranosidase
MKLAMRTSDCLVAFAALGMAVALPMGCSRTLTAQPADSGTDAAISGNGGATGDGGSPPGTGAAAGTGGTVGSGGIGTGTGGGSGGIGTGTGGSSGGATTTAVGPCDIYAADGGPCVAAHSTVRALFGAYSGRLYQLRRADGQLKDIGAVAPGGLANSADQDAFCASSGCTISIIYDQSGRGNHLTKAPRGGINSAGEEAEARDVPITVAGKRVYGEHNTIGVRYRNDLATGTATGDGPETMYMVASGDYYNDQCCFDYGNTTADSTDKGEFSMEAIYFGNCTTWGQGAGSGPWVMVDFSNSLWAGNANPDDRNASLTHRFVTAMVKGDKANRFAIKVGDAKSGGLTKVFEGPSSTTPYGLARKEGAIVLGAGVDASNHGIGNFFEGVMTAHYSSDAADQAVQANIVAAGYGQGGSACPDVTPCGGDVVGTWTVTSSCMTVAGARNIEMLGMPCLSLPVTGTLQVTGTWSATADGKYSDDTTTSGDEQLALGLSCERYLAIIPPCPQLATLVTLLGYASATCTDDPGGWCACQGKAEQKGGAGSVSAEPQTTGTYTTSGNVLTTDGGTRYLFCVSGNKMTWTLLGPGPATTGTIVFQKQ